MVPNTKMEGRHTQLYNYNGGSKYSRCIFVIDIMNSTSHIGIIGAGISGLVTAKVLRQHGARVTVFEKASEVGGVWIAERTYDGLTSQNTKQTYAFSDYSMPDHFDACPTAAQMREYLNGYVDHFGFRGCIKFDTTVIRAAQDPISGWQVSYADAQGALHREHLDFLVVANGTFHHAFEPQLPGREVFEAAGGKVYHTQHLPPFRELEQKRLAVVGNAKSACDVTNMLAERATYPVVHTYRRDKWKLPLRPFRLFNAENLLLSRLGALLLDYPQKGFFAHLVHALRIPKLIWRGLERRLDRYFGLSDLRLRPIDAINDTLNCTAGLAPEQYYDQVRSGRIIPSKGELTAFTEEGLELKSGKTVQAEVIIFGTGYTQSLPFLDPEVKVNLTGSDGNYRLYRNILPIGVPDLAFNGYNSSMACQFSAEMAAYWLGEYLFGYMSVPPLEEQRRQTDAFIELLKSTRPEIHKGTCVGPFTFHYVDELLRDMGASVQRTHSPWLEWVRKLQPSLYGNLWTELRTLKPKPVYVCKLSVNHQATHEMVPA